MLILFGQSDSYVSILKTCKVVLQWCAENVSTRSELRTMWERCISPYFEREATANIQPTTPHTYYTRLPIALLSEALSTGVTKNSVDGHKIQYNEKQK